MTSILMMLFACSGGEAPVAEKPAAEAPKADDHGHEHGDDAHGHDHGKNDAAQAQKPPAGAKVMFANIEDGAELTSPIKVEMAVEGMTVKPAGELVENTGHHHLVIDSDPVPFGTAVPADDKHIHFGKGQTETEVELEPGKHTLMLQFADGVHRSYGEQMSTKIEIVVK